MRLPDSLFVFINPTVRFLLKSPLHRFWSGSLMLITFTGRKTQRVYTTPVRYLKSGETIWAFTSVENKWWRNLTGGAQVRLLIRGKQATYRCEAITGPPEGIRDALRQFLSRYPQDAPYYDIALTSNKQPVETDLERVAATTVWVKAYPQ
jgi:hypothetical protein